METHRLDILEPIPEIDKLIEYLKLVPPNGIVLEVGTYLGGTTTRLAAARPDVKIFTIDPCANSGMWEGCGEYGSYATKKLIGEFGIIPNERTVRENCNRFPNIHFMKGYSPQDFLDWETPIDLYFEDGDHGKVWYGMSHWANRVKPGGYLIAHDYHMPQPFKSVTEISNWPDWDFVEEYCNTDIPENKAKIAIIKKRKLKKNVSDYF